MPKYNHAYDIAFSVVSEHEKEATPAQIISALQERVNEMVWSNNEYLYECVGAPFDTFEMNFTHIVTSSKLLRVRGFYDAKSAFRQASEWAESDSNNPRDTETPVRVYTWEEWVEERGSNGESILGGIENA